ncbi:MAG: adaptor protein MecA [Clostridia bacterium]|nr:adaptor protein MecA [Clostridia bacterium]
MIFETLNENVMLLELSGDEMEKFHITYDTLNCDDENTKNILKSLLYKIDTENRISKGEKVLVEAMPTENGGCFFILTFARKRKTVYRLKRNNAPAIFHTDTIDNVLDFLSAIRNKEIADQKIEVFSMDSEYFLHISQNSRKLNIIMCEYGESVHNVNYEKLKEYGESLGTVYLQ